MHCTVFRMLEMSRLLQPGRDFLLNHLLNYFFYSFSRWMPRDPAAAFGWRSVPSARREGEVSLSLHCSQSAAAATAAAWFPTQQWRLPVLTATLRAPARAVAAASEDPRRTIFTSRLKAAACKVGDRSHFFACFPPDLRTQGLVGKGSV